MKKEKKDLTYISVITDDQGGGGSYCGNCNFDLGDYLDKWRKFIMSEKKRKPNGYYKCPGCGEKLK